MPELDSTWVFVETVNEQIEKGYEPPIKDFSVLSQQGEDITEKLLTDPRFAFWMIAPSLKEADDDGIDRLNELYDYCAEQGYNFICLTASDARESDEWRDNTGAEYGYAFADKKMLMTILRSNPGVMLVKDGTIYWKASTHSLPDEWTEAPLDQTRFTQIVYNPQRRLLFLLLALTLPLVILFLTEKGVKLAVLKFRERQREKRLRFIRKHRAELRKNSEES